MTTELLACLTGTSKCIRKVEVDDRFKHEISSEVAIQLATLNDSIHLLISTMEKETADV